MKTEFPILYKRNTNGTVQQWKITAQDELFWTISGKVGGKLVMSLPTLCKSKNKGKSNYTSPEEQAKKEAQAKFDKQLKKGYFEDINDIDKQNFIKPTLAVPLKKRTKPLKFPAYIQTKYNGVACIIDKEFGPRSRTGERYHTIPHIEKALKPVFDQYPNLVLHGELYNPDLKRNLNRLSELVSVVRQPKDITPDLLQDSERVVQFWIYDGYIKGNENKSYENRWNSIQLMLYTMGNFQKRYIHLAPTSIVEDDGEIAVFTKTLVEQGEEGAIVRMVDSPYQHKRSQDIIKFKHFEDDEFEVVDIEEGNGNWTGCAKKIHCKLPSGETFVSNVRGSQEFLTEVFQNKEKYIGQIVTVEYQQLSEYGVPQIPYTDLVIRNYE